MFVQPNPSINPRILIHRLNTNDAGCRYVLVTTEGLKPGMPEDETRDIGDGFNFDGRILDAARELSKLFPNLPVVSNIERFIGQQL